MANILLLDESDVAGRAMRGIVNKAGHRCVVAYSGDEAWRILREGVVVDLLFIDILIQGNTGMAFLQRVRDDPYWKSMPIVVYTTDTDAKQVRKALSLKVQNYLLKPYNDQAIFAEIAKAVANPWRNLLFEEPKSFCAQMGMKVEGLIKMRRQLISAFDDAVSTFPRWAQERDNNEVFARLDALANDAEAAGVWAGVDYLHDLRAQAELANWGAFKSAPEYLDYASRLIFSQINPNFVPEILKPIEEMDEARLEAAKPLWLQADVEANGPLVSEASLQKEVRALVGCPMIDTAAAAFYMAADGRASSISRVMELAHDDPGLCVQVLLAANRLQEDELAPIEDPNAAVSRLGEIRLTVIAKTMLTVNEKFLAAPPVNWANYCMFLVGVAKVSQFICNYLEFQYLSATAYTAGLMHDLGRLLLLKLHPWSFIAISNYVRDKRLTLQEGERRFLGCTARDLAVEFAITQKLPPVYVEVMRNVETPEAAKQYAELVAMVSLARHVTLHNRLGNCGDTPGEACPPIASTPAWEVLQPRLFPSFDLRKFEGQAHAYCRELKQTLTGRQTRYSAWNANAEVSRPK